MKQRVDALLVARGMCETREQAKRLVLAGEVRSGDRVIDKPSTSLPADAPLFLREKLRYVGRGGLKLEAALAEFGVDVSGLVCVDIGASTGGFTDCLLQHGAQRVHAVDVGTNQLAWKIRSDPRVVVKEQFNARNMVLEDLGEAVDLAVMDLSFISLTKVLPAAFRVLKPQGQVLCLIKPQFELRREDIGKGGIVRDPVLHQRAVDSIHAFVDSQSDWSWRGVMPSPITGTDGNHEFIAQIQAADCDIADREVDGENPEPWGGA